MTPSFTPRPSGSATENLRRNTLVNERERKPSESVSLEEWHVARTERERIANVLGPKKPETIADRIAREGRENDEARKKLAPSPRTPTPSANPLIAPTTLEPQISRTIESRTEQLTGVFQTAVDSLTSTLRDRNWALVPRAREELATLLELMSPEQRQAVLTTAHERVVTALQAAIPTGDRILKNSFRETAKILNELSVG